MVIRRRHIILHFFELARRSFGHDYRKMTRTTVFLVDRVLKARASQLAVRVRVSIYVHDVLNCKPKHACVITWPVPSRACHVTFPRVFVQRYMELDTLSPPIIYSWYICIYMITEGCDMLEAHVA